MAAALTSKQFKPRLQYSLALLATIFIGLSGCGSSDGSDGAIARTATSLSATAASRPVVAHKSLAAAQRHTLEASDFGVEDAQSYAWRQLGGSKLALEGSATAAIQFMAPDVEVAEPLSLELTVTETDGGERSIPIALTVVNESQVVSVPRADYRLAERTGNLHCSAPSPPQRSEIILQRVFSDVTFDTPVDIDQAPGDDSHWYISNSYDFEIHRLANSTDAQDTDIVLGFKRHRGQLRGMAFHPNFDINGRIYVQAHRRGQLIGTNQIIEFTWSDELDAFDPDSEKLILSIDSPHAESDDNDHGGGHLAFGPDGYLYAVLGDGTRPLVFNEFSQDTDILWGSLLRIDVDQGGGYAIPADNPFADGGGRPEIFAWGLRHPWKFNFDSVTGDLWLGDVGRNTREEINRIVAGGNYGWPWREGHIKCPDCELGKTTIEVDPNEFIEPVLDYEHDASTVAVTGGYVYRGQAIPALQGAYIFGDYGQGKVWALRPGAGPGDPKPELLTQEAVGLVSFGQDVDGELYVLDFHDGRLFKLVKNDLPANNNFPTRLSETGCVTMDNPRRGRTGMIPYTVQVPLWSDNAEKSRWMALPDDERISMPANSDGDLELPVGTVLIKHFSLFNRMIETRLFMRHDDGEWAGYTYEWNDEETEAFLLEDAKDRNIDGQTWHYPSRTECLQCHTRGAGRSLGLTTRQLNSHQSHGQDLYSQLRMLDSLGVFRAEPNYSREYAALENDRASIQDRARAYLDVNCSGCHRPDGNGGRATMDMRLATPFAEMNLCGTAPAVDTLGIPGAALLNPGNPEASVMYARMNRRDQHQMPPLGTNLVDPAGIALIFDWIADIEACP